MREAYEEVNQANHFTAGNRRSPTKSSSSTPLTDPHQPGLSAPMDELFANL
jgi:hypothetical protein